MAAKTTPLNSKQVLVRDFILAYQEKHGHRPTYKEIMLATGIEGFYTVSRMVKRLERAKELALVYVKPNR